MLCFCFFFSSRRRHTRSKRDWSSDVCSSDLQRDWYVMVGPKSSDAPIIVRNNVYIFDAHPKSGDTLNIPEYEGYQPFLYVLDGEISVNDITLGKQEAVTDLDDSIPPLTVHKDATLVLFLVDLQSTGTLDGTISGEHHRK